MTVDSTRDHAADDSLATRSPNTRRAYAADWKHYAAWCRREGRDLLAPDPQAIGTYLNDCAIGTRSVGGRRNALSTIERRLSALVWAYLQRGLRLDRQDPRITAVLVALRRSHATAPKRKTKILPKDLSAMLDTCDRGTLRGLRDRAMLLIGFAGGLRRSEITGLDCGPAQSEDGRGWIQILPEGLTATLRGRSGWRKVRIGRGSSPATCPVQAVELWLKFARISRGPLFRRVTGQGKDTGPMRLNDREVARLVKRTAQNAGLHAENGSGTPAPFSAQSLRGGGGRAAGP